MVVEIESDIRRRRVSFLEIRANSSQREIYLLYALAMANLGIRPAVGDELWYQVNNPHLDLVRSDELIRSTKHQLEKEHRVEFPDLDY